MKAIVWLHYVILVNKPTSRSVRELHAVYVHCHPSIMHHAVHACCVALSPTAIDGECEVGSASVGVVASRPTSGGRRGLPVGKNCWRQVLSRLPRCGDYEAVWRGDVFATAVSLWVVSSRHKNVPSRRYNCRPFYRFLCSSLVDVWIASLFTFCYGVGGREIVAFGVANASCRRYQLPHTRLAFCSCS